MMNDQTDLRQARFVESQVPDYNTSQLGQILAEGLRKQMAVEPCPVDRGSREKGEGRRKRGPPKRGEVKPPVKKSPTNSERMNRMAAELSPMAFKVHMIQWKWRGAPARGKLPYFTVSSLAKFCRTGRHEIRRAIRELKSKGWIRGNGYDKHQRNELYRLVPIRKVPKPGDPPKEVQK